MAVKAGQVYKHLKTGRRYWVVAVGRIEKDLTPAVIYESLLDNHVWVRPMTEFVDGRFQIISYGIVGDFKWLLNAAWSKLKQAVGF